MYIKNIAINNIGPIESLSIEFPFTHNQNPKPIVFVGENGTGKTIILSQIIDSFYEIGSSLFDDVGFQDGLKKKYYKVSGGSNLQVGKKHGFSILRFQDNEGQNIEYFDKIGLVSINDFTKCIDSFSLVPNKNNDNQKKTTNIEDNKINKLQNEWSECIHFFQPAYRYEEPFWKNDFFIDAPRFEDCKKYLQRLDKEIEILSSTKVNKTFLLDLVLDRFIQTKNPVNVVLWDNVNAIIRKIMKNSSYRLGIGPRGGSRISIMADIEDSKSITILPSIDNLSLGESILLNLFVNIIRHCGNSSLTLDKIQGIVVIDEIDVHLHTDFQNKVLPELLQFFPQVQFIVTTHSPLFLLGMKEVYGEDGFEIRCMPQGSIITTERFSEFENAYKVLKDTEKFENDIKAQISESKKTVLFVEGDYDIRYLKKAGELLNKETILGEIEIYNVDGFGNLDNIWRAFSSKTKISEIISQKIILLYDCDTNKINDNNGKVYKRVMEGYNKSSVPKHPKINITRYQDEKVRQRI